MQQSLEEVFVAADGLLAHAIGRELAAFMGEANVEFVPIDDQLAAAKTITEIYAQEQGLPVTPELIDEMLHESKSSSLEAWWEGEGSNRIHRKRAEMRAYIEGRTGRPLLPL